MTALDKMREHLHFIIRSDAVPAVIVDHAAEALGWVNAVAVEPPTEADMVDELQRSYDRGRTAGRNEALAEILAADRAADEVAEPPPSRYGAEFDRLAGCFVALDSIHDGRHNADNPCTPGCVYLAVLSDLRYPLTDALARRPDTETPAWRPQPGDVPTEEPPVGSIIKDKDGDTHERGPTGQWYWIEKGGVGEDRAPWPWQHLHDKYGPLTLVRWGPGQ